jgi:sulfite reductase alpha subunit-like flavoprotein
MHYSLFRRAVQAEGGYALDQPLTILVGTMTGTAQLVAEEVADALKARGVAAEVRPMDGLDAGIFACGSAFLICSSTYGQGDVPDNAQALFADLERARPDLSRIAYGVIALGDHTYAQTFCFGGKRFDKLLESLGARRIGEPLLHDASAGTVPEEVAVEWIGPWIDRFGAERDQAA